MRTTVQAVMPDLLAIRPQRPRPMHETPDTAMPIECEHVARALRDRCGPGTRHTLHGVPVQLVCCFQCDHAAHERGEQIRIKIGTAWALVRV